MRIGILYLGKGGGCSHYTLELARALAPLADVTCYLPVQNTMVEEFGSIGCRIRTFDMRRGAKALFLAMLRGREESGVAVAIAGDTPEVIIDTGSSGWGLVVQRQLGGHISIAQVVHDVNRHPGLRAFVDSVPGRLSPVTADVYIGLSDYSYKQLQAKYPHKPCVSSKHGIILPSGDVDLNAVAAMRRSQLFFGRIDPYKGLDILLDAYAIVRRVRSDISLDIVGRGFIGPKTLQRINDLSICLTNRFVSDDEVKEVIAAHGVIVLPYTSATQSGVAAVALGNGLPCIATNVGALPEQIRNERNGLVVPAGDPQSLADAMMKIADSEELAKTMAKESLRIGREDYSWSKIASDLLSDLETSIQ